MNAMDGSVKRGPEAQDARDARRDRWSAHRAQRREEFVAAALRVLAAQGPDLPMDAVAAEAGVTKPVLYRYFADKAALVEALGEYSSALLLERILPAIGGDGPAMARVRDGVEAYFGVIDEHPNLYWLVARRDGIEPGQSQPAVNQDKESIANALTAVIGDYLRLAELDSGAAEPWAYGVTGLVQSTGEWWLRRRSMSRTHVVGYCTQLIWAALDGIMRDAGIHVDPAKPLPTVHPKLTVRRTEES